MKRSVSMQCLSDDLPLNTMVLYARWCISTGLRCGREMIYSDTSKKHSQVCTTGQLICPDLLRMDVPSSFRARRNGGMNPPLHSIRYLSTLLFHSELIFFRVINRLHSIRNVCNISSWFYVGDIIITIT